MDEFDRLLGVAKRRRSQVKSLLEECYKYVLPLDERRTPFEATKDLAESVDEMYDATASSTAQDLASDVLNELWPADAKPYKLELGHDSGVDPALRERINKDLAARADAQIAAINSSGGAEGQDWYSATHEALLDWTIAQGFIAPHMGSGTLCDVWFEHLPLNSVVTLRTNGQTSVLFRESKLRRDEILQRWPGIKLRSELKSWASLPSEDECEVTEGVVRDWTDPNVEAWRTQVKVKGLNGFIHDVVEAGPGSKPFIDFAFMVANGETLGRGPVRLALPHIRVINAVTEMYLDELDMKLGGIWGYEAGSFNPEQIEFKPRMIIPYEPGTKGIQRLDAQRTDGDFKNAVLMIQAAIRDVMYGFDLGPLNQTPRSATEVMERKSAGARRKSGPHHRLLAGLVTQTAQFVDWALVRRNKLPPLSELGIVDGKINGRSVVVKPAGPMTQSQQLDEVLRFDRLLEIIQARFGPAAVLAAVPISEAAPWLREKMGVDPRVIRPAGDISRVEQMLLTAAAQKAASPTGVAS